MDDDDDEDDYKQRRDLWNMTYQFDSLHCSVPEEEELCLDQNDDNDNNDTKVESTRHFHSE
jgi:hypothetical protein